MKTLNTCMAVALTLLAGACASASAPETTAARIVAIEPFEAEAIASRNVWVWLPPGYDASKDRYPVVYMQDGQNLFDSAKANFGVEWEIDETMTNLIASGEVRPAIIVGIQSSPMRFEEYMPKKAATGDVVEPGVEGYPSFKTADLVADRYLAFMVDELKPQIDARFRTLFGPADTFVFGSSMGGLISAYAVSEHPDVFGGAACISTHWPAGNGATVEYFSRSLPTPGGHRFYFDYGTATLDALYEPHQLRMDAGMESRGYRRGIDWVTEKFDGAEHNEKSWAVRAHNPLKFLLGPPR
jgi:predicted alpha/beta superfamily hydrolase